MAAEPNINATDAVAAPRPSLLDRLLGPYRVLRGKRDLQLLFGGQVVSTFGDWLYVVALIVLVYNLTGSATTIAALTFVRLLPYALFSPISGVLADRWDRKRLMIAADLGRGLCMLGLMLVNSPSTLWLAFPLVFISTTLTSVFRPAMSSVLPGVVGDEDDLVHANTLWSQMDGLSFVVGPSLGSLLLLLGRPHIAFVINGLTFVVSALSLVFVRIPEREAAPPGEEQGWLAETRAGFRFLFRENEGVLAAFTFTVAGMTLFAGAFWSLMVVLAEQAFGLGSEGTGFLNAAYGAGGLLGGFLVGPIVGKLRLGPAFIWGVIAGHLIMLLFGLSPAGALPFVVLIIVGITDVFSEISATTLLQTATPNHLLGRVFGAFQWALVLATLVGALIVGPLADVIGPRATTVLLALVGLAILLVCLPRLRKLEAALGVRSFIRQVPVLASLSHKVLDDVASRMQLECVPDGIAIVREGEPGDRLYIVKSGEADVLAHGDGTHDVAVATLGKMDYFGEIALLRDVPRTATVRARGQVELYSLSRADFHALLQRSEELQTSMTGTSDARYIETQNKLLILR